MPNDPVIWLAAGPGNRADAAPLLEALKGRAQVLSLGPAGSPGPALELPAGAGLDQALMSCPHTLRPAVCVCLPHGPAGADSLPCPVLGWLGAAGCDGALPDEPQEAAARLLEAAAQGPELPWLERVQVNLPLFDLLGQYRDLATAYPLNFEVGLDWAALDGLDQAGLDEAARLLKGRRLTAHMPFLDLKPGSKDARVSALASQRLEQAARWAVFLQVEQAVLHLGFDPRCEGDPQNFPARLVETMAPAADLLSAAHIALALENTYEHGPELLLATRDLLAARGVERVGFCLDVGHVLCFSRTSLQDWWQALSPHIFEMHLHDNDGQSDMHRPVGAGAVDWEFLAAHLPQAQTKPVLTLEPHREPDLWASLRGLQKVWGHP